MEALAGGEAHRAALEWSGVEPALIGEVRPLFSADVSVEAASGDSSAGVGSRGIWLRPCLPPIAVFAK